MSGLLPSSSEPEPPEGDPRVIGVDEADADDLLSALSSETARAIFQGLHDEPATPSELADRVDTSLQNAQYHIEKLESADLIDVIDTRYSAKGREMKVYGPSSGPVVLFAGSEDRSRDIRTALASLLGGIGILGVASLAVQRFAGGGFDVFQSSEASGAATTTAEGDMGAFAVETTQTVTETVAQDSQEIATASAQAVGIPPGALFFAGGLLILVLAVGWWYTRG